MANNSSANVYIDLETIAQSLCLSPPYTAQIPTPLESSLSTPGVFDVKSIPVDSLGPPYYVNSLSYLTASFISFSNFINGVLTMPNVIHIGDEASLNVTTLVMTDKTGAGNATLVAPSGASYQFRGARLGFENLTGNYVIPQQKSGFTWTNTAAPTLLASLPSGASLGTSALFVRTGGIITVRPPINGRVWNESGGWFYPLGSGLLMATSGSKLGVICDGNNGWYTTLTQGTINPT